MQHTERGEIMPLVLTLVALIIIIFVFIIPSHKVGPFQNFVTPAQTNYSNSNSNTYSNTNSYTNSGPGPARTSTHSGKVSITSGNASYAYQPYEEYITIQNNSQTPVDITGWKLTNARNTRVYRVGNTEMTFPSEAVIIPQAAKVLLPNGGALSDVVLEPNERAIIVTGAIQNTYPYKVTSFKENECTGYLGSLSNYTFSPYMNNSCISPSNEPGLQNLDRQCQDFVTSMSSCHTPEYNSVDSTGQVCNNCVDRNPGLSSSCVAYIQSHFSYPSCLAMHQNDANFLGDEWRIYLGQPWELWAKDHETISLYDISGNLVDYQSY